MADDERSETAEQRAGQLKEGVDAIIDSLPPEQGAEQLSRILRSSPGIGKLQADEIAARAVGYSRTSLQRYAYIRRMAERDDLPAEVLAVAQEAWEQVRDAKTTYGGHGLITPAYLRVREAFEDAGLDWLSECGVCDREFRPRRRDAVYCSATCRQRARRSRRQRVISHP